LASVKIVICGAVNYTIGAPHSLRFPSAKIQDKVKSQTGRWIAYIWRCILFRQQNC